MMALNDREKLFADEYIKLGNAYQAALNAGYSKATAKGASKWINPDESPKKPNEKSKFKPAVRAFIDERMAEKEKELIADQDEVLRYLTAVMRGQSASSVLARDIDGSEQVIEKPPDEKERLRAAELIGKRYGLYTEKVDVNGSIPVVISGADDLED
jgi:phage terminase small subunit